MLDMHKHGMHYRRMTLSEYLEAHDITASAFARAVGMSQSQVSRIARGKSKPSWDAVAAIAKASKGKVTADDFVPSRKGRATA